MCLRSHCTAQPLPGRAPAKLSVSVNPVKLFLFLQVEAIPVTSNKPRNGFSAVSQLQMDTYLLQEEVQACRGYRADHHSTAHANTPGTPTQPVPCWPCRRGHPCTVNQRPCNRWAPAGACRGTPAGRCGARLHPRWDCQTVVSSAGHPQAFCCGPPGFANLVDRDASHASRNRNLRVNQSLSQMLGASGVRAAADHTGRFMDTCQRWRLCLADRWLPSLLLCTAADSLPADTGCSRPCSSTSSVGSDDGSCREMMEQVFSALMGATLPCLKWQLQRDFGAQWQHVSGCLPSSVSCMGKGSCHAYVAFTHTSPAAHLSCLADSRTHKVPHMCHVWLTSAPTSPCTAAMAGSLPLLQALAH